MALQCIVHQNEQRLLRPRHRNLQQSIVFMSQSGRQDARSNTPQTPTTFSDSQEDPEIVAYQKHQASVQRLSLAEEARTLIKNGKFGVLSTISSNAPAGFPCGSVVEYSADDSGRPIFSLSSLSPHSADVRADSRCSLTVTAESFRGLSDARVNIVGHVVPIAQADVAAAKERYMSCHPASFWVEFGDFTWFKMEEILSAR